MHHDKFYKRDRINTCLNITRMVWVIAFSSPDNFSIDDILLRMKLHHNLLNFVYHDKSCYRDKVNRAAGLRTGVMVFANSTYKLHLDMKPSAPSTGTQPSGHFCLDEKHRIHLPGLGKNHATATQTATAHTTGPLCLTRSATPRP